MKLGERILLALSAKPGSAELNTSAEAVDVSNDTALRELDTDYPDLSDIISGKSVMDFGCGVGHQSIALAMRGASMVLGVDSNSNALAAAREQLKSTEVQCEVKFIGALPNGAVENFDVVLSQNSMEHFSDPEAIFELMLNALRPDGKMLITFGPPWYAPYGSHMHFFTKFPWVNIWFTERTVMNVRSQFRDDGATRYEEVESGLNKMTVRRFERIVQNSNIPCRLVHKNYRCVKGFGFLSKIPLVREMFINRVICTIQRARR